MKQAFHLDDNGNEDPASKVPVDPDAENWQDDAWGGEESKSFPEQSVSSPAVWDNHLLSSHVDGSGCESQQRILVVISKDKVALRALAWKFICQ